MRSVFILLVVALLGGVAGADVPPGPPPDSSGAPQPPPPPADTMPFPALKKVCDDALNANPALAKRYIDQLDKASGERRDAADAQQRQQTTDQIILDERQVILAYSAMWLIAAGFVIYLWSKQRGLKDEILRLRRDLEAATKDS